MTLLAAPRPECVLQMRQPRLPPRALTVGAMTGLQIAVQIGTQTTPSMVEFVMPCSVARALFRRGLTMCDEIEGVAA